MTTSTDPLDQLNPFSLLMDARHQLFTIVQAIVADQPDRVATALGAVVAHDLALREIALAYADGERTFDGVTPPDARAIHATFEDAQAARNALFEAFSTAGTDFATEVLVPWAGTETWHIHLIGLAMFEGAQAHALREGDELPARLGG